MASIELSINSATHCQPLKGIFPNRSSKAGLGVKLKCSILICCFHKHYSILFKSLLIVFPNANASIGGTALPTWVYCGTSYLRCCPPVVIFERNTNQSGKD